MFATDFVVDFKVNQVVHWWSFLDQSPTIRLKIEQNFANAFVTNDAAVSDLEVDLEVDSEADLEVGSNRDTSKEIKSDNDREVD